MNKNRYKQEILLLCQKEGRTAEQIFLALKKQYPVLGIGTVYRNLSELIQEKKLKKITGILDKAVYEILGAPEKTKISGHVVCENSNKVIKVDVPDFVCGSLGLPEDFEVERVEVLFYGKFKNCKDQCKGKIIVK